MAVKNKFLFGFLIVMLLAVVTTITVLAGSFSLVGGGASGGTPDDIYGPTFPGLIIPGVGLFEVDAFTYGHTNVTYPSIPAFEFSVDPASIGAGGSAVAAEAGLGEAQSDVFASVIGSGTNGLVFDGNGSTGPPLGLIEPSTDDVDGYDKNGGPVLGFIWWSVDPPTTGIPPYLGLGFSPGDIFVAPAGPGYSGAPVLYATALALGLTPADDIDGLVILEDGVAVGGPLSAGDCVLFSLAPGSPFPASPADVLAFGPCIPMLPPGLYIAIPAPLLGLLPTDNIDALAIPFTPTAVGLQNFTARAGQPSLMVWLAVISLALVSVFLVWQRRRKYS
jgi:hypothetical protein